MTHRTNHLMRVLAVALVAVTWVTTVAFADNATKTPSRRGDAKVSIPLKVMQYGSPGFGPADMIVNAVGKVARPHTEPASKPAKVANSRDTSANDNKIVSTVATADVFTAVISLSSTQAKLDVGIYNMLGKRMADVYTGSAGRGSFEFSTPISQLPEGVYICIVQGSNFRRAAKFYLSR